MNAKSITLSLLVVFIASIASAQHDHGGHFDIYLARPLAGTQTVYGGYDGDHGEAEAGHRIFGTEMGEDPSLGIYFGTRPGINNPGTGGDQAPGATALNPGDTVSTSEVAFEVDGATADLFFWNGLDPVAFTPATGVDFTFGAPTSSAGADGSFHEHPFLTLDDLDANASTFPTPGVYLGAVTAAVTGLDPSDPIFLVMGTEGLITADFLGITQAEFDLLSDEEIDEELEHVIHEGVEYVEGMLVPEPSAALLVAVGLGLVAARRRVA